MTTKESVIKSPQWKMNEDGKKSDNSKNSSCHPCFADCWTSRILEFDNNVRRGENKFWNFVLFRWNLLGIFRIFCNHWNLSKIFGIIILLRSLESYQNLWNSHGIFGILSESLKYLQNLWNLSNLSNPSKIFKVYLAWNTLFIIWFCSVLHKS